MPCNRLLTESMLLIKRTAFSKAKANTRAGIDAPPCRVRYCLIPLVPVPHSGAIAATQLKRLLFSPFSFNPNSRTSCTPEPVNEICETIDPY